MNLVLIVMVIFLFGDAAKVSASDESTQVNDRKQLLKSMFNEASQKIRQKDPSLLAVEQRRYCCVLMGHLSAFQKQVDDASRMDTLHAVVLEFIEKIKRAHADKEIQYQQKSTNGLKHTIHNTHERTGLSG